MFLCVNRKNVHFACNRTLTFRVKLNKLLLRIYSLMIIHVCGEEIRAKILYE